MIDIQNISYEYRSPSCSVRALNNITLSIPKGHITAVIGHTGSGKSTLMEIIAGITKPVSGSVKIDGSDASPDKVGLVFQYPEYQLFAETVYDDIAFGPRCAGLSENETAERVKYAAEKTHIPGSLLKRSPFELSGGQMRLAALAGILAMNRRILLLDEPAAGLDPSGKRLIFSIMAELIKENGDMTIVFVTHSMENAAEFADNIIVLDNGELIIHGSPDDIFAQKEILFRCGLDIPEMLKLSELLLKRGINIGKALTVSDAYKKITGDYKQCLKI